MSRIHEGFPEKDFEKPESVVTALACNQSGNLAADFCQAMGSAYVEYFDKDFVPKEPCTGHLLGEYYMCALTGQAASETCPVRVPGVPIVGGWCPHSINADGTVRTDPTPAELAQAMMAAQGQQPADPLQTAQDAVAGLVQQTPENPQPVPDLSQMIPVQPAN